MTEEESRQFKRIVDKMDRHKEWLSREAEEKQVRVSLASSPSPLDCGDTAFLIEVAGRDGVKHTS